MEPAWTPQTLEYAGPTHPRPSRLLAALANLSLLYPLFLVGSLYGEWYLASAMLGHPPRPSLDDPKFIDGSSWLHPITAVAILGLFPAACAALIFNTMYVVDRRIAVRNLLLRVGVLLGLWLGMIALFRLDTRPVMVWWLD